MFRLSRPLDIVTVFHNAQCPSSVRAVNLLTLLAAKSRGGTLPSGNGPERRALVHRKAEFELNVTERQPTATQLQTIIQYADRSKIAVSDIVARARDLEQAQRLLDANPRLLTRPLIVDWMQGALHVGFNEQGIIDMIDRAPA